jgi:hypothetical protein
MRAVDWAQIPGTRWYQPELATAAANSLVQADTPRRLVQAVADLRFAVSNDHAGSLYPASVPAAGMLLQVILDVPGEPRAYALGTLLDWWGTFRPEPGFEVYDDPASGRVEVTEGIMQQVRQATDALRRLAVGEDRRAIDAVLRLLDRGWVIDRELTQPGAGQWRAAEAHFCAAI